MFTQGDSQSADSMIEWIQDILLPYLDSEGRGSDEWALLIMDPASAHRVEEVLELLLELRVAVAMMPASTTWKFQMIDVAVGKPFKDAMCDQWANWMMETCEVLRLTPASNFRHPTPTDCNAWVSKAWRSLSMSGVLKKTAELGMSANPGPPVEGYEEKGFEDVQPEGAEEEFGDADLWYDLLKATENEL